MNQLAENDFVMIDFLRHGECEDNVFLRGKTDSKLTLLGTQKMEQALINQSYSQVISSPKTRCLAFAEYWCESHKTALIVDDNWQERDFGDWDGLTYQQIQQQSSIHLKNYLKDPFNEKIPNAETFGQFLAKISQAWLDLQNFAFKSENNSILVISHGGPMLLVLKEVLKMETSGLFHLALKYGVRVRIQVFKTPQGFFAKLVGMYP